METNMTDKATEALITLFGALANAAERNNAARKIEKDIEYKTKSDLRGYRWVIDEEKKLYIVEIKILDGFYNDYAPANNVCFWTKNCKIIKMFCIDCRNTVGRINGVVKAYMNSKSSYSKGNEIKDDKTFFCLSIEDLIKSQGHEINRALGKIVIPIDPFQLQPWIEQLIIQMNKKPGR